MPRWPWHCMIVSVNSAGVQRRAGREVLEEVPVDVERVEEVELEHVHEVDPHQLVALHRHRLLACTRSGIGVDGVDLVRAVEVGVEAVHDHDELVRLGAPLLGVDDECAVEALGDVRRQRGRVAVVEVQAERVGVELVDGSTAGLDQAGTGAWDAVAASRVEAVEVDRVRVGRAVDQRDAQPLALACPQSRAGHPTVVRPGRELHPGRDLDLVVAGDQRPLAQHPPAGEPRRLAAVEVAQQGGRVKAVGAVVDRRPRPEPRVRVGLAVRVLCGRRGRVAAMTVSGAGLLSERAQLGRRTGTQHGGQAGERAATGQT